MIKPSSHRATARFGESGSALLAALITLMILTTIAASIFMTTVPAYRGTYQATAWQEAKLAADAGVDLAVAELQKSLPKTNAYTWPGWTKEDGSPVTAKYDGWRMIIPPGDTLSKLGDGSSNPKIANVMVDVVTRDTNWNFNPWYRIRSTGYAEVGSRQLSLDSRDLALRRMTLNPTDGSRPHVTRTVEVVARPVYLWEYCLKTKGSMSLGGGSDWVVDSYDSRYALNGTGPSGQLITSTTARATDKGIYAPQYARAFGNVASDLERPDDSLYGMLIDAAGARVRGEVQTNGGDNPDTTTHENVYQGENIDPNRITSEYDENLSDWESPSWATTAGGPDDILTAPDTIPSTKAGNTNGATADTPLKIKVTPRGGRAQGGFTVTNPGGGERFVDIYVDNDIDLNGSTILIEPGVHVNLYLNGNMNFRNMDINYSGAKNLNTSQKPGDLLIYGVKPGNSTPAPRVESSGNGHIVAAFYGPQYEGNLDGNTEIMGSFVLNSYHISGGGGSGGDSLGAGLHYDEALGVIGPIKSYKSVSYFEDTRKDLE